MNGEKREVPGALPEMAKSPESSKEKERSPERQRAAQAEASSAEKQPPAPAAPPVPVAAVAPTKDGYHMKVERVLEENLGDIYFSMPAELRARFKAKGEETAVTIRSLIETGKAKARTVLDLIREWLKLIPGVNRYFLEQEAKIKTDKIMLVAEDRKKEKETQV